MSTLDGTTILQQNQDAFVQMILWQIQTSMVFPVPVTALAVPQKVCDPFVGFQDVHISSAIHMV